MVKKKRQKKENELFVRTEINELEVLFSCSIVKEKKKKNKKATSERTVPFCTIVPYGAVVHTTWMTAERHVQPTPRYARHFSIHT